MSQEQAERAKQQLYEDTSARDELTDDEAAVLLKWGEGQIDSLAAQELDDAAFDEAYTHLRRVMTNVNRFTGKRAYAPPEELRTFLNQMAAEASALGATISAEQLAAPQAQAADDNIALIHALTSMVTVDKSALLNKLQSQSVTMTGGSLSAEQMDRLSSQAVTDVPPDSGGLTVEAVESPETTSQPDALAPSGEEESADDDESDGDKGLLGQLKDLF